MVIPVLGDQKPQGPCDLGPVIFLVYKLNIEATSPKASFQNSFSLDNCNISLCSLSFSPLPSYPTLLWACLQQSSDHITLLFAKRLWLPIALLPGAQGNLSRRIADLWAIIYITTFSAFILSFVAQVSMQWAISFFLTLSLISTTLHPPGYALPLKLSLLGFPPPLNVDVPQ